VALGLKLCGASGRVAMLDAVSPVLAEEVQTDFVDHEDYRFWGFGFEEGWEAWQARSPKNGFPA
jgi:hypothetical protein